MTKKFFWVLFSSLVLGPFLPATESARAAELPTMPPTGYDKRTATYPAGKIQDVNYQSKVTNSTRKMVVYTPPGYDPNKKYPVLYGIHGIGAWPSTIFDDWCCGGLYVADNLLGEKKIEPLIMVAMDNNDVDSHRELFEVIIPYVESHYPVIADADHRAIYGYSLGGGVTFAEGIGNLDTFHHICPTSAAPFNHPSDAAMFPNGGTEAKQKIKTLFISCGTGDWDGFYPPNEATHKYCVANSIPHTWLSVEGGGHDGSVWRPAMWNCLQLAFPATSSNGSGGAGGVGGNDSGAGGSAAGGTTARGGNTASGGATSGSGGAGGAGTASGGAASDSGGSGGAGMGSGSGGATSNSGGAKAGGAGGAGTGGSATGGVNGSGGLTATGGATNTGGVIGSGGSAGSPGTSGGAVRTGGTTNAGSTGGSIVTPTTSKSGCTFVPGRGTFGAPSGGMVVILGALLSARRWRRRRSPPST